ncbi:hypothetical protein [Oceanobacillus jeddahense]|uniref:Uncharacterized protein n=2 Tax=Oceanobacillus jeddahense TaxID=1462527 RepID=A0ABY5JSJ6_9BACI|nr:hypothetical protein [Oceanobacillus jeddahense]UUI03194.1 hypothetical protein NP439_00205 [Oceanobacillus jeddahense]
MERFPHLFNYRNLTEANVKDQYINSRMLVNLLKNEIAILFPFIITLNSIRVAKGFPSYMNTWSLLFIILLFAGTITLFIIRSQQLKKKSANETE